MKTKNWIQNVRIALALIAPVVASQAIAQDWYNVRPLRSGDLTVHIDFQVADLLPSRDPSPGYPNSRSIAATPLWVNVKKPGLNAGDRVRAMIINYSESRDRYGARNIQEVEELELRFAEPGRFTAQARPLALDTLFNDTSTYKRTIALRQEVVVWVNGSIYKDEFTGQNLAFNIRETVRGF